MCAHACLYACVGMCVHVCQHAHQLSSDRTCIQAVRVVLNKNLVVYIIILSKQIEQ